MTAFYNEIDKFAAQWLRNLIDAGHIAPGVVDERDIRDIEPRELEQYTQCHFFAGIGVWSYALRRAGWPDDRPIWTGSCPCQPFSAAGLRKGFADERHLWPSWHWLIQQCQPAVVVGEQVADALAWLDLVSADLEAQGYAFGAGIVPAAGFSQANRRERLYFAAMANTDSVGQQTGQPEWSICKCEAITIQQIRFSGDCSSESFTRWVTMSDGSKRPIEPSTFPLANGTANHVGRLRAYGNAINAAVAEAWCSSVKEICDGQYGDLTARGHQSAQAEHPWPQELPGLAGAGTADHDCEIS